MVTGPTRRRLNLELEQDGAPALAEGVKVQSGGPTTLENTRNYKVEGMDVWQLISGDRTVGHGVNILANNLGSNVVADPLKVRRIVDRQADIYCVAFVSGPRMTKLA
jgi:hypothetical protein